MNIQIRGPIKTSEELEQMKEFILDGLTEVNKPRINHIMQEIEIDLGFEQFYYLQNQENLDNFHGITEERINEIIKATIATEPDKYHTPEVSKEEIIIKPINPIRKALNTVTHTYNNITKNRKRRRKNVQTNK